MPALSARTVTRMIPEPVAQVSQVAPIDAGTLQVSPELISNHFGRDFSRSTRGNRLRFQKKATTKEDGRSLIYYHFPDTATDSQTQAFNKAPAIVLECESDAPPADRIPISAEAADV